MLPSTKFEPGEEVGVLSPQQFGDYTAKARPRNAEGIIVGYSHYRSAEEVAESFGYFGPEGHIWSVIVKGYPAPVTGWWEINEALLIKKLKRKDEIVAEEEILV